MEVNKSSGERSPMTYSTLTDEQLAAAIASKTDAAEKKRNAASLLGRPADLDAANRLDEVVVALRAEQARRAAEHP
jgi:hypothetical protein